MQEEDLCLEVDSFSRNCVKKGLRRNAYDVTVDTLLNHSLRLQAEEKDFCKYVANPRQERKRGYWEM